MASRYQLSEIRGRANPVIAAIRVLCVLFCVAGTQAATADTRDMSIGLAGVVDWSVQQPFLDVMKTARPWIGHRPGQWGGMEFDELESLDVLDENGWPMRIPDELRGIGTVVLSDMPVQARSLAGRYRVQFQGDGIVEVGGRASNVIYGDGEVLFDFEPGPGPVVLTINKTDRDGIGDYIRDITLVRMDHIEQFDQGEIFNPDWTQVIAGFGTFRFMDWMETNDSTQSEWVDRPKPDDFTYARHGVPLEIMVKLANELQADAWFNMPHLATDEYMQKFATYVRDNLHRDLIVYAEFSNEVWNWQFTQAVWAEEAAAARWNVENGWMQLYGLATSDMAAIWKNVFGSAAEDRLVTVISTQTGWQGLEQDALNAPLWVAENPEYNKPPAEQVDAYAIAGYFGRILGTPERAPRVKSWIADSHAKAEALADAQSLSGSAREIFVEVRKFDAAIELAAADLRDGSVSGDPTDTLLDLARNTFPFHAEIAASHGLDLIMYEGGTHVAGVQQMIDDDELTEFFVVLNYAPEMGSLYGELINSWATAGGKLFNVYADVVDPGKWGSWGGLRHLDDQNPRWNAIQGVGVTQ